MAIVKVFIIVVLAYHLRCYAASFNVCSRWNCPCSGADSSQLEIISKRFDATSTRDLMIHGTRQTRKKTRQLLDRLVTERFRGNDHHVQALQACVQHRSEKCLVRHLQTECRLDGFPQMNELRAIEQQTAMPDVIKQVQRVMSSLAVYVDQARKDESRHVTDPLKSLETDIELLQETGIYDLLCSLQIGLLHHNVNWESNTNVSEDGILLVGCRTFGHQAPIDNRNYMTLYMLDKLLQRIEPSVSSMPPYVQQQPPLEPSVFSSTSSKKSSLAALSEKRMEADSIRMRRWRSKLVDPLPLSSEVYSESSAGPGRRPMTGNLTSYVIEATSVV